MRIMNLLSSVLVALFTLNSFSLHAQQNFTLICPTNYLQKLDFGFDPYQGPKPLVVMVQDNFSTDIVLGGATPVVVLYEDGQLIVKNRRAKGIVYWSKQLDADEITQFEAQIAPIYRVPEFKTEYDITPNTTSMPRTCFLFRNGEHFLVTQVRGLMLPGTELGSFTELARGHTPDNLPTELTDVYKYLEALDRGQAKEWQPKFVEVLLWPRTKIVTDGAVDWPTQWPALDSNISRPVRCCLGKCEVFSILLDGALLSDIRRLLSPDVIAVNVAGRSWMFAYRYMFPSEPEWRSPFNRMLVTHLESKDND
ncbi:MAG: hypothetical protein ACYC0X_26440 [Pirellulaceae bacterium]